jgi:hypothetical protein
MPAVRSAVGDASHTAGIRRPVAARLAVAHGSSGLPREVERERGPPDDPFSTLTGGLQGIFSYTAFTPTRGVGVFIAINKFDFSAAMAMAGAVNELIAQLAPR